MTGPTFAVGDRCLVRNMRGQYRITELLLVRGEAIVVGGVDGRRMVRTVPTSDLLPHDEGKGLAL